MLNSKKIIFDCERMKNPHTGLYHFCKELGAAILRTKPANSNIFFYLPQKEKNPFGTEADVISQKTIHKLFKRTLSDCNLWHSTHQTSDYIPYKRNDLKIITTIHDLNFLHGDKNLNKQKKYLEKVQKSIDRSDAIVTISQFVKEDVTRNLNTTGKEIHVIYNGRNKPAQIEFKQPLENFSKPFFFTIGTIAKMKNFHVLPALLLNNDCNLVISGVTQSQPYKQKIIDEARKLGVEERVIFTGPVSENEKYWLLKNCCAFVFPSLAEGFGLPVIEAMQLGTPVLLSKATSLPEIGGPHALYFEDLSVEGINSLAVDFLKRNYTDGDRRQLIDWAAQFDWDTAAKAYWNIYTSLLNK